MIILKRILSNIIDFLFFLTLCLLVFFTVGLKYTIEDMNFACVFSFFGIFILPILSIGNTLGKEIVKLNWKKSQHIKLKLLLKYCVYFSFFLPGFSISSALLSTELWPSDLSSDSYSISLIMFFSFVITDFFIFLLTLGRTHILDYVLKLEIHGTIVRSSRFLYLTIIYCFFGLFLLSNITSYKYKFTLPTVIRSMQKVLYEESFPVDDYFGAKVFVLKQRTSEIVSPSDGATFLYPTLCNQKILYLLIPKIILTSPVERFKICTKLIQQSRLNDIVSGYNPTQTKITLINIESGKYFESYESYYIYYYENKLDKWGVYGGITVDSTTEQNYLSFINNYRPNRIDRIEKEFGMKWSQIIKKSDTGSIFQSRLEEKWQTILTTDIYPHSLKLTIDSSNLTLSRIEFIDVQPTLYQAIKFPPINAEGFSIQLNGYDGGEIFRNDENLDKILSFRNLLTFE